MTHTTSGNWRLGFALALTTALFWGLLPIALKPLLAAMDPLTITWYRFAVASLALGLFLKLKHRLPKPLSLDRGGWVLLGICILSLTSNFVLYVLGLSLASPTVTQVVVQLSPLFLLLGGLVVFRERFTALQWSGFVVLVGGCFSSTDVCQSSPMCPVALGWAGHRSHPVGGFTPSLRSIFCARWLQSRSSSCSTRLRSRCFSHR